MRIPLRPLAATLALVIAPAAFAQSLLYSHDFGQTAGWPDSDVTGDLSAVYTVVGGEYLINPLRNLSYALAPAPVGAPSGDMVVESDVRLVASQPDSRAGIACRVGDGLNFIAFNMIASGGFEIVRVRNGEAEFLSRGPLGIDPAGGARLRAECQGSELRFSIDGREMARASDPSGGTNHGAGLLSLSPVVAATNAAFDNFALYGGGAAVASQPASNAAPSDFDNSGFSSAGGGAGLLPALSDMAVHADNGMGEPGERRTVFPVGQQQVFVLMEFEQPVRANLRADWYAVRGVDETRLLSGNLQASGESTRLYLAANGNFSAGLYRVDVYADSQYIDQREFSVY